MDYLLKKGETVSIATGPACCSLRMCSGTAWLTRYDDPRDYFLRPGETFAISATGTVVVEALEDTALSLEHACCDKPVRATVRAGIGLPSHTVLEQH